MIKLLLRVVCIVPLTLAGHALGDDSVRAANAHYADVRADRRSDMVLLPVLGGMDPTPAVIRDLERATLLTPATRSWATVERWATAEPQKRAIEALEKVTSIDDWRDAYAFGQPYGTEAMGINREAIRLIQTGLYTEIGDPPLLAARRFGYMPALDALARLVHVEVTRRLEDEGPEPAMDLMVRWVYFSRQMADRAFAQEQRWGYKHMILGLRRLRDLAYQDHRGAERLAPAELKAVIDRLDPNVGIVGLNRLSFPTADKLAAEQIIERVITYKGGPNEDTFAPTMARLAADRFPLRLFGEAARWDGLVGNHANWWDANGELEDIFGDWNSRWPLDWFDPRNNQAFEYPDLNPTEYAVITTVVSDMSDLFDSRQMLRVEVLGTRAALASLAFYNKNKVFASAMTNVRPEFLERIEPDPYNRANNRNRTTTFEYFVPVRDQVFKPREEPYPHQINVWPQTGEPFAKPLGQDQFVLYSVGDDGRAGWAKDSTDDPKLEDGDLLLWPPLISLYRQYLLDHGLLE